MLFSFIAIFFSSIWEVQRKCKREVLCWARWHETHGLKPVLCWRPKKKVKTIQHEVRQLWTKLIWMLLWPGHLQFIPRWIFGGIFLFIPLSAAFFNLPNLIFSVCLEHFPETYVGQMWIYHLPPPGAEAWEYMESWVNVIYLARISWVPFFYSLCSHISHIYFLWYAWAPNHH